VPGTWRFRDYRRHDVLLEDTILSLRVDESLYFPNARFLQQEVLRLVSERPGVRHLVLQASAINHIDTSALETLEELQRELSDMGVVLHLSEVKGPVMDRLERSGFLQRLTGRLFLTHLEAIAALREASKAPAAQASTS
jgi:SulP family sulfate permease